MTEEPSSAPRSRFAEMWAALRTLSPYIRVITFALFLLLYFTYDTPLENGPSGELLGGRGPELLWPLGIAGVVLLGGLGFEFAYAALHVRMGALPSGTLTERLLSYAYLAWRLAALAFIGYHLTNEWWQLATGALYRQDVDGKLCRKLSSVTSLGVPLTALGYLVGLASVCFHLVDALNAICLRLPEAQSGWLPVVSRAAARALGVGLFIVAANSVLAFATGASLLDHLRPDW